MSWFETTRWSVVQRAGGDSDDARSALAHLCVTYREPVLAFIRSRGFAADRAEDLTQAFFVHFLERAWYAGVDPARGRFRAFLLAALKHFLIDARAETHTLKRGGGIQLVPLDDELGGRIPTQEPDPEQAFEEAWVRAVLEAATGRLRAEAAAVGKAALFDHLRGFLIERPTENDYARTAQVLGLQRNTVAVAVYRLRRRLRELVREELSQTTANRDDFRGELRRLRGSLYAGTAP